MKNEMTKIQTEGLAKFNVTDAKISELREKYKDATEYDLVKEGVSETRIILSKVESTRKELKADALEWGKMVDGEAKRIKAAVQEIQEPMKIVKKTFEDEKEEKRQAKKQAEATRVYAIRCKIDELKCPKFLVIGGEFDMEDVQDSIKELESKEITTAEFEEMIIEATKVKNETIHNLNLLLERLTREAEEKVRIATEHEKLELDRKKFEAEQKIKEEEDRKRREEEQAKINAERRQLEAEQKQQQLANKIEQDKLAKQKKDMEEERRKERAAAEKIRMEKEAKVKAEQEAEEKAFREKLKKIDDEKKAKLAAAQAPDIEKMKVFAQSCRVFLTENVPTIKDTILNKRFLNRVQSIQSYILDIEDIK